MKHLLFALAALMMVNLEAETVKNHSHLSGLPPFRNGTASWTRISFEQAMSSKGVFFRGSAALRSAMLNNRKFFGLPAVEMRASYNAQNKLTRIDIIYANKGDSANLKKMSRTISRSAKELAATLTKLFGPEKRKNYGMKNMQNRVSGWDGGNAEILLDFIRSEYVILHIEMTDSTVQEEKKEDSGKDVKDKDFSQCVKTNNFGDAFITGIPMINQGSKGYCVPATVERVLRYYGINDLNMHQLADKANTNKGGGTSVNNIISALTPVCSAAGLKKVQTGDVRIQTVKRHIDRGIPIFWVMYSNPEYEDIRNVSRRERSKHTNPKEWLKVTRKFKARSRGGSHMCLIIGYNEKTDEIAVSNSWGDHEIPPSWVPLKIARKVSQGRTFVLMPK